MCFEQVKENLDANGYPGAIEPSSLSIDSMIERGIEFDAEDVQLLNIDPREMLSSTQLPLLHSPDFTTGAIDWSRAFPSVSSKTF
jgi:hypothetical protein